MKGLTESVFTLWLNHVCKQQIDELLSQWLDLITELTNVPSWAYQCTFLSLRTREKTSHMMWCAFLISAAVSVNKTWRLRHLTLIRLGYFGGWKDWGGGAMMAPPWDLGRGSRDWRENFHNGSVLCNLQDCIFRFCKIFLFYFILINYANLCKKSDFLL